MTGRIAAQLALLICILAAAACAQLPTGGGEAADARPAAPAPAPVRAEAPAPPGEYRLGPGDLVRITVYNNPDLATEAEISQEGKISFPLIGEAALGGLTRAEAEKAIAERLGAGGFVPDAHVNLLITQHRSRQVSVIGEVHKPGKYPINHPTVSVTDLLAAAGGVTPKASHVITVIRTDQSGGTLRHQVNVNEVLGAGDLSKNVRVGSGDIIYVPPVSIFYIYGEVRQPGAYQLAPDMTVRQAISVGGGLTVRGTERGIRVERRGPDGKPQIYRAELTDKLKPDDVVRVPESWF
jgi:polysaccharide biosynthesis/export protein